MGNLIGEEFKPYVKNQVKLRQEVHGKQNRSLKELTYLNSRTSWIKLASGVLVEESRLKLINQQNNTSFLSEGLAKSFILSNGTQKLNSPAKSGILKNQSNPAYGILQNTTYGIVPMPGIESVSIKNLDNGSIKRASIKIKAYSKLQFDIIDILYMRLGYTVILEWGDSHYLNNKSKSVEILRNTILEENWFNLNAKNTNQFKMLNTIENFRNKYSGNYDALFGKITNFKWDFNPDGTYSITVDILSLGDVIESLKMNIPSVLESKKQKEDKEENKSYQPLPLNNIVSQAVDSLRKKTDPYYEAYNETFWESLTYGFTFSDEKLQQQEENRYKYLQIFNREDAKDQGKIITIKGYGEEDDIAEGNVGDFLGVTIPYNVIQKTNIPIFYDSNIKDSFNSNSIAYHTAKAKDNSFPVDYIQMNFQPSEYQYYIRFGALLKFFQDTVFPYYNQDKDNPILKIDHRVEDNEMFYVPNMVSIDPRVCIISNPNFLRPDIDKSGGSVVLKPKLDIYPEIEPFRKIKSPGISAGYLMNIYINFQYVVDLFQKVDKKGDIKFMEMMRNICTDLNVSLGGVNNLEPKMEPDSNTLIIYDRAIVPSQFEDDPLDYDFEIFGYNFTKSPNLSNFVHQAGITTEITSEYATMVTIGSTSVNQAVGETTTAFSKWNEGIIDRFKRIISTGNNPATDEEGIKSRKEVIKNYYKTISPPPKINALGFMGLNRQYLNDPRELSGRVKNFIKNNVGDWESAQTLALDEDGDPIEGGLIDSDSPQRPVKIDNELINAQKSVVSSFYKETIKKTVVKNLEKTSNQGGFMPFNLNLDIEGISGIKIYSKLKIQQTFLPTNYPQTLKFIVTGVDHELNSNKWTTKINTIGIPKHIVTTSQLKSQYFNNDTINNDAIKEIKEEMAPILKANEVINSEYFGNRSVFTPGGGPLN